VTGSGQPIEAPEPEALDREDLERAEAGSLAVPLQRRRAHHCSGPHARPLLFAIAYRILGNVAEAEAEDEDAVQETWLRYEASPTQPRSTKAYLSAVVTRVSIDVLRSARVRR